MNVLTGRVVVASPHLDDGVLSLGAAIAEAGGRAEIEVLTVMAGDPDSAVPAGPWDARAGFATAGEAARARREEDLRACAAVGARPAWLPFPDEQYPGTASDEEIRAAVLRHLDGADAVIVPGAPLQHQDHRLLHDLFATAELPVGRLGLFVEQPYATFLYRRWPRERRWSPPGEVRWEPLRASRRSRRAKHAAARAYASQLPLLTGRPALLRRIARYESARGGETVGWISRRNR